MNIIQELIGELKRESASTRKLLEIVPDGNYDWQAHEKSFPLGRIAGHIAEIPQWIYHIAKTDEFDLMKNNFERYVCTNREELLAKFDEYLKLATETLEGMTEDDLQKPWKFTAGDHLISHDTKYVNIRSWGMNHIVHHRAQLGVYLRLQDIEIPGMYGPSADDRAKMKR